MNHLKEFGQIGCARREKIYNFLARHCSYVEFDSDNWIKVMFNVGGRLFLDSCEALYFLADNFEDNINIFVNVSKAINHSVDDLQRLISDIKEEPIILSKAEAKALDFFLSQYPDNLGFGEIISVLLSKSDKDRFTIWDEFKELSDYDLACEIKNLKDLLEQGV